MKKLFFLFFLLAPLSTFAWAYVNFNGYIGNTNGINNIKRLDAIGYAIRICQKNSTILVNSPKILVKYWKTRFYTSGTQGLNSLHFGTRLSYRGWISYHLDPQDPLETPYCITSGMWWPPVIVVNTTSFTITDEFTIFDVWNKLGFTYDESILLARANGLTIDKNFNSSLHRWQILVVPILFNGVY